MKLVQQSSYSAVIIGGGAVGFSTAIALAQAGHHTAIISGGAVQKDWGRTAALLQGSLEFLYSLGLQAAIEAASWPLATMRIIDAKGALVRAPTAQFRASELGLSDFGRNVSNAGLVDILNKHALNTPNLDVIDTYATKTDLLDDAAHIYTSAGDVIEAAVIIAADGRNSPTREAAGIATRRWSHQQSALTFHMRHAKDHEDISTEFHTNEGPFTLVPLGPYLSSVVWMIKPDRAKQLQGLSKQEFALKAEQQCQSILGKMELQNEIGEWPLKSLVAQRFFAPRLALVGEAAHAFPPIGAQGLNLGLRDAAALARLSVGSDLSSPDILARYDADRRLDVEIRSAAVDVFNRSILSEFLPVDIARSLALGAINNVSPLRKFMMRMGLGNSSALDAR
jgi:2-octaprenyl-6-methoxyphenol hydroxylase